MEESKKYLRLIEQDNKLIAEFIGLKDCKVMNEKGKQYDYYLTEQFELIKEVETTIESNWCEILEEQDYCFIEEMKFHTSYDWLMPVVDKIESIECVHIVAIQNKYCHILISESPKQITHTIESSEVVTESMNIPDRPECVKMYTKQKDTKLEAVYHCVVEFIKWYNKQK